jgi:DNA polymerase I-like protein with 3'-5' exonuclease and polymerase domains
MDEARDLHRKYCTTYSTAVGFLRDAGRQAVREGFLANLNGRRRNWIIPYPESCEGGKWGDEYKGKIAKIEREGGNFMIQSVNADITKKAMADIRRHRKANGVRTSFVNAIYDEIVTRTNKDDSASFHEVKLRLMKEAAEVWMKNVPMEVDGAVHPYWTKG